MASPYYVRSFISAQSFVGLKRGDARGIQHIKPNVTPLPQKQVHKPGRYLSEHPSTYLT